MNKIYLLLVIDDSRDLDLEEYTKTGHVHRLKGHIEDWILNEEIGIDTISGFKLSEEEAKNWAMERCKLGEELPDRPVSEKIIPVCYTYIPAHIQLDCERMRTIVE